MKYPRVEQQREELEPDGKQQSDYVTNDVEVLDKSKTNDESGREKEEVVTGGEEENESYEDKGDDAEEENVEGRKNSSLKISDKDLRRHCLHMKRKRYLR